ncbi:helix-turn-helix domain-containing protein [Subtercola lobariae]|uniref:HTH cro/C1-type domain-containing protein n=1 Tax=Subtercola lobariae TaxID=1588641 RepID=A0A917EYE6_9MICO|nr:helix-turn-helix transcriptional regulator [Subtercola lobariae]GGF24484.1 hypothetical protein GCM10011399_17490 [Subtercola lobariae]
MKLKFRNLTVTPDDAVELWGEEGILSAIDRGNIRDWARIRSALDREPFGKVASELEEALPLAEDEGAKAVLRSHLRLSRQTLAEQVATVIQRRIRESGLTRVEFARHLGTSRSRLSTYENGTVTPSATMMLKIDALARRPRRLELPSRAMPPDAREQMDARDQTASGSSSSSAAR